MALPPITSAINTAPQGVRTPTSKAQAAQRAFFQAASSGAAPTQTAQPVAKAAAALQPKPIATPVGAALQPQMEPPTRIMRPGSLVDIKV